MWRLPISLSTRQRTVLAVEGDPAHKEILHMLLQGGGWRILNASTAEEAITIARAERPDLITLDLALPDADGHYVLEELQADPYLRSVPVIIVSSRFYRPAEGDQVVGVLPESLDPMELDRLIRLALSGDRPPVPGVAA